MRIRFSRDGKLLASSSEDETVRLWQVETGQLIHELRGHTGTVTGVSFSPDGHRLASCGLDWNVKIWDVTSGEEIVRLRGRRPSVALCVEFSPDGKRLVAWGTTGGIYVWNSEPQPIPPFAPAAFERATTAWHRAELAKCEEAAQWLAAAFHLRRLLQLAPMPARHYSERAVALEKLKPDSQALIEYARAFESGEKNSLALHCAALLWLHAGRHDEYRRICDSLLAQIDETSSPSSINLRVWICILSPQAVADPSQLASLQHAALANVQGAGRYAYLNTLGAALYRAGRIDEAIGTLHESEQAYGGDGVVEDWLFLAMAYHRQGKADAAQTWLDKSVRWLSERSNESSMPGLTKSTWQERFERELFQREAESLIRPVPAAQ